MNSLRRRAGAPAPLWIAQPTSAAPTPAAGLAEPDFGWPVDERSMRRSCWAMQPPIHPTTIIMIVLCIVLIVVLGWLGCFVFALVIGCIMYRYYL